MKTIPLAELLAKATPGPWAYDLNHTIGNYDEGGEWVDSVCQLPSGTHDRRPSTREKIDMTLLAHAANHIGPLVEAAHALLSDVHARHPGETLRCPFMRQLEAALHAAEFVEVQP